MKVNRLILASALLMTSCAAPNKIKQEQTTVASDTREITNAILTESAADPPKDGEVEPEKLQGPDKDLFESVVSRTNALECVRNALENGADVNARDDDGETPLMQACWHKNTEIIDLLLSHGADIHARNKYGETMVTMTAWSGNPNVLKFLLSKGANIDDKNDNDETPLILATKRGRFQMMSTLISEGADINAGDTGGRTALSWAVWRRDLKLAKLLVENGADVDSKDISGDSLLIWALSSSSRRPTATNNILPIPFLRTEICRTRDHRRIICAVDHLFRPEQLDVCG
jgi:ankyrin repeat protein